MKCKECGTANNDNMKFCKYCGKELLDNNISSSNKKSVFNIIIISLIIITVMAIAVMVGIIIFSNSGSFVASQKKILDDRNNTIENTIEDTNVDAESTTADVTASQHKNVIDEVDLFDDIQLENLDSCIEKYESDYNISVVLNIKLIVDGDLSKFAQDSCDDICGEDGVLIVVDYEDDGIAIGATGNGEKYIKDKNNSKITDKINDYFMKSEYYIGCNEVLDLLFFDRVAELGFEKVQGSNQVVYVKKDKNSTTGKLTLVEWYDGKGEILYEIDTVYLGMEGVTNSPSESKSATPAGTFKLGFAFSDHSLNTNLKTELITSGAVWVNDPDSNYYNTLQYGKTKCSYWSSAEDTYNIFKGGYNDACILIEHNGNGYKCGERGKGSCIYIAGKNSGVSTSYGDVNITSKQMEHLLSYLDEAKNPHIVIS